MAKIQFLTILLTVTCFLGVVVSVIDKEFKDMVTSIHQRAATVDQLLITVQKQSITSQQQSVKIERQSDQIQQLEKRERVMTEEIQRQDALIRELNTRASSEMLDHSLKYGEELMQNITIEERVALLEIQVTDLEQNVSDLDADVNFLFDETVIQDERLFSLEQDNDVINQDLDDLQDQTLALDSRVTALEENGGSNGNSSVAELEVRVKALEGTPANHETRISAVEVDVNDLIEDVSDQETRLTAAEENIQGLQMTDVELDARVTALEEDGGNANGNGTVAFSAALTSYSSISVGSAVLFNEVLLNEGDGYDNLTGTFALPPGGDGFYYFSIYLSNPGNEDNAFGIEINNDILCVAYTDEDDNPYQGQSGCNAATFATEGDMVQVVYLDGDSTTPLFVNGNNHLNGFSGFNI